jgi:hypothetical protein
MLLFICHHVQNFLDVLSRNSLSNDDISVNTLNATHYDVVILNILVQSNIESH